ncbi:putative membrane protein [Wickerhamomyces ciferrii]|uniref:Membrane protein n=1 Tax=Wickerhamomyces ciferrii (strain ATCC 14091 / BCRC 22168 / CBS 111 / JCM 3599 / NBRC 0793 / NRRL Y-1031 F-60-10) TaxID=1206466 RepID=K0KAK9_WICCF|nr:uncharacterized protein BN7_1559 [Wickerhamomyces ciferrii]CCH42020.1 putative membrane protein [Wickerhamomyces ciferrii]
MGLNLSDQLVFYKSYHYNTINVLIHSIFVPIILFVSSGLLTNLKSDLIPNDYFNASLIMSIGYSAFYLYLDLIGGLIATPILLSSSIYFTQLTSNETIKSSINHIFIMLFIISWIVQFIGHGVFEKRAPALLDNLVQALVLAPFFVLFELMFLLGFRQELKHEIDSKVEINIQKFKESKKN